VTCLRSGWHRDGGGDRAPRPRARITGSAAPAPLKPVVDRVNPLERIVEAHRHVDQGHKRDNVVVELRGEA